MNGGFKISQENSLTFKFAQQILITRFVPGPILGTGVNAEIKCLFLLDLTLGAFQYFEDAQNSMEH